MVTAPTVRRTMATGTDAGITGRATSMAASSAAIRAMAVWIRRYNRKSRGDRLLLCFYCCSWICAVLRDLFPEFFPSGCQNPDDPLFFLLRESRNMEGVRRDSITCRLMTGSSMEAMDSGWLSARRHQSRYRESVPRRRTGHNLPGLRRGTDCGQRWEPAQGAARWLGHGGHRSCRGGGRC